MNFLNVVNLDELPENIKFTPRTIVVTEKPDVAREVSKKRLPVILRVDSVPSKYDDFVLPVRKDMSIESVLEKLNKMFVVVPAYNEERVIGKVLDVLLRYFSGRQIIVVNDGSTDRTEEIAIRKGVTVVSHKKNIGLGGALRTGINFALENGAEVIATFDGDGQHRMEDLFRVVVPILNNEADFSYGNRIRNALGKMPIVKLIGNVGLDIITFFLSRRKFVVDTQSGLRVFSRKCAENVKITREKYAVSSEIIIEVVKKGFRIKGVPIEPLYDEYTKNKGTNVKAGFIILRDLILRSLGH